MTTTPTGPSLALGMSVLAALTGCATNTAGQPAATSETVPGPTGAPGTPLTTPAGLPGSPTYLTSDTLCGLLTPAEVVGLGLDPTGEADEGPFGEECRWASGGTGILVVAYGHEFGIAELNRLPDDTYSPITIGDHTGERAVTTDDSNCSVMLAITDGAFVAITGSATGQGPRSCALADVAAPLVEARLP